MGTDCTRCGRDFKDGETAYASTLGSIKLGGSDEGFFADGETPWADVHCSDCEHKETLESVAQKHVKVEVSGGVADVTRKDAGVTVEVFDHDDATEQGEGYQPALFKAEVVIDDESQSPEGAELPCDLGGMQPDS